MPSITIDLPDEFDDNLANRAGAILQKAVSDLQQIGFTNKRIALAFGILAQNIVVEDDPLADQRMNALMSASAALYDPDSDGDGDEDDADGDEGDDEEGEEDDLSEAEIALAQAALRLPEFRHLARLERQTDKSMVMSPQRAMALAIASLDALAQCRQALWALARKMGFTIFTDNDAWEQIVSVDELDNERSYIFLDLIPYFNLNAFGAHIETAIQFAGLNGRQYLIDQLKATLSKYTVEEQMENPTLEALSPEKPADLPFGFSFEKDLEEAVYAIANRDALLKLIRSGTETNPLNLSELREKFPISAIYLESWIDGDVKAGRTEKVKRSGRWALVSAAGQA